MDFVDRLLKCCDCGNEFVFTAGEQLFFFDKQFKNDPKRCKLCKAKRAGLGRAASSTAAGAALPLSRTETRTKCSACGVETTVPFRPTQGRPVLCRSCFQLKRVPTAVAATVAMDSPAEQDRWRLWSLLRVLLAVQRRRWIRLPKRPRLSLRSRMHRVQRLRLLRLRRLHKPN